MSQNNFHHIENMYSNYRMRDDIILNEMFDFIENNNNETFNIHSWSQRWNKYMYYWLRKVILICEGVKCLKKYYDLSFSTIKRLEYLRSTCRMIQTYVDKVILHHTFDYVWDYISLVRLIASMYSMLSSMDRLICDSLKMWIILIIWK
jgi:hypothetical protein